MKKHDIPDVDDKSIGILAFVAALVILFVWGPKGKSIEQCVNDGFEMAEYWAIQLTRR